MAVSLILVFLGAAIGSLARYALLRGVGARTGALPWLGLLVVNLSGCVLIGAFTAWLATQEGGGRDLTALRAFVASGLLGGFTSFSAISVLSDALLREGRRAAAIGQVVAAVVLAIPAVELGRAVAAGVLR